MEIEITNICSAIDLPDKWDGGAGEYFQTREFLSYTEKYNPCKQRYYLLCRDGIFETGVVVYTLKLDLLTYLGIPSPFRMNIAGIPCSVSAGGLIGNPGFLPQIAGYIRSREKGLLLFLNLAQGSMAKEMIAGRTLPTIILANRFHSWDDYLDSMKACYRRRVRQFAAPFVEIQKKQLPCSGFNDTMYRQYLEVLKRSKGKLETLSLEFFRQLPQDFYLTAFYDGDRLIGWYISVRFNEKFYFFLGGLDYRVSRKFKTYFNLLLNVVREGIEKGALLIDLGQTAEIPKLRLGGQLVEKTMLAGHSNRVMSTILKAGKSLLEYAVIVHQTHVFKEMK